MCVYHRRYCLSKLLNVKKICIICILICVLCYLLLCSIGIDGKRRLACLSLSLTSAINMCKCQDGLIGELGEEDLLSNEKNTAFETMLSGID